MLDLVPPDPDRLLAAARAISVDEAIERVRAARPRIVLGDAARQAIAEAVEQAR